MTLSRYDMDTGTVEQMMQAVPLVVGTCWIFSVTQSIAVFMSILIFALTAEQRWSERTVATMSKLKCVECPYSEYDEYFHELWCMKKHKEVDEDDTCDKKG